MACCRAAVRVGPNELRTGGTSIASWEQNGWLQGGHALRFARWRAGSFGSSLLRGVWLCCDRKGGRADAVGQADGPVRPTGSPRFIGPGGRLGRCDLGRKAAGGEGIASYCEV